MPSQRTDIYIVSEIWREFKTICKREGTNASAKLREYMQLYVQKHRNGNPQLTLPPFTDEKAPSPAHLVCSHIGGVTNEGKVYCRLGPVWVQGIKCYGCRHNELRSHTKK